MTPKDETVNLGIVTITRSTEKAVLVKPQSSSVSRWVPISVLDEKTAAMVARITMAKEDHVKNKVSRKLASFHIPAWFAEKNGFQVEKS